MKIFKIRHTGQRPKPASTSIKIVKSLFDKIDQQGLSRSWTFQDAGYDGSRASNYATGKVKMSSQMLEDLANYLGYQVVLMRIE